MDDQGHERQEYEEQGRRRGLQSSGVSLAAGALQAVSTVLQPPCASPQRVNQQSDQTRNTEPGIERVISFRGRK